MPSYMLKLRLLYNTRSSKQLFQSGMETIQERELNADFIITYKEPNNKAL